ncbi:unnamed protein product, partial [Prorocentrum cordatum]
MLSAHDFAVLLFACAGLAIQIALLVRGGNVQGCLRSIGRLGQQLRSARVAVHLRSGAPKETQTSREAMMEQKVTELVMGRQVKQARRFVMPCSMWCFVVSIEKVVLLLDGAPRSATPMGDVVFFVFYATMLLLVFRQDLIQPGWLDLWGSFIMLLAVLTASPWATPTARLLGVSTAIGALRLSIALCISLPAFVGWSVVYWASLALHAWEDVFLGSDCLAQTQGVQVLLVAEVSASVALVLISRAVREVMEGEARQQVEAQASRSGLDASESLLGTICDAVVELDVDLRLRSHSPSLATMLLHSPGHCLDSSKLDRFLFSDEDKVRFNESMHVPAHETGAIADAFHVKMRDSLGSKIDMEVFHVCFVDSLTELPQHLVGLREHSDNGVSQLGMPDLPPLFDFGYNEEDHSEVAVVFDAVSFDILRCSDAFTVRFGSLAAGASFADLLYPGEPLLQAFCDTVNSFANGDDPVSFFDLRPLSLQLTGGNLLSKRVSFTLSFEA